MAQIPWSKSDEQPFFGEYIRQSGDDMSQRATFRSSCQRMLHVGHEGLVYGSVQYL